MITTNTPFSMVAPTEKLLFIKDCLKQDHDIINTHLLLILQYLDELVQYVTNVDQLHKQQLLQHGEVICRQCVPNVVVEINELRQHNDAKHDAYKKVV